MIDEKQLKSLVQQLYAVVSNLEDMFPGRHFTPDGHLVGSLGECLVAEAYDLQLMPASNSGFDAVSKTGVEVEIKATQSKSVAFRHKPEHTIVILIKPNGTFEEVYNGPGTLIWKQFRGKKRPSNGQYQISLNKLKTLSELVDETSRLPRVM